MHIEERMKKVISIFFMALFLIPSVSMGAVSVKKAASVKVNQQDKMESATSLVPTVIGLVGSVKSLNAQQDQLEADCVPTGEDVRIVNDLVKEWARIGDTTADVAVSGLGTPCSSDGAEGSYANAMQDMDKGETCYEFYGGTSNQGTVWYGFPKASYTRICKDGNAKDCRNVSNIYDVFAKIPFSNEDYSKSELASVTRLIEKSEKCAPGKIAAAKRELWGGFLTQTLSGVGQSAGVGGTDSIMQMVSSAGGGGIQSMLPSLGSVATQMLDK